MEDTCYLIFIFQHDFDLWTRFVSHSTSKRHRYSHVDIVVHNIADGENVLHAYSSYMNEPLTLTELARNNYSDDRDAALAIPVTPQEAMTARAVLDKLVHDRTLYNITDIPLCLLPVAVQRYVKDVPADAHIQSVFCSQLAILVVRRSLVSSAPDVLQVPRPPLFFSVFFCSVCLLSVGQSLT
jgi:hypothetical protein